MSSVLTDKSFTGAAGLSAVNCSVIKRSLVAVLAFLGICVALPAEQLTNISFEQLSRYQPETLVANDSASLLQALPMLCFLDQQFLPVASELQPVPGARDEVYRTVYATAARKARFSTGQVDAKDAAKTIQPVERRPLYYSGEVGAFYGHASGKVHGDAFGSYMESTVGDEHVQITVGASYDQFNGRGPRRGW